jgi:hypothetical protein
MGQIKRCTLNYNRKILWHICIKQELWSQRKSSCLRTALKQYLFLGNGNKRDNGTTSFARQQILNKQEQTGAATERLGTHVPAATDMRMRMNGVVCAGRAEEL